MLVLVTDFGLEGPYIGQMRAVLQARAPGVPVIDLVADLAPFNPRAAAYVLPAYCREPFPPGAVFLCVIDPGVGTARDPVVVEADGRWFVGPDNGLFSLVVRRARQVRAWTIAWRPEVLSASFHGRDLFAPAAAALAGGEALPDPGLRDRDPETLDYADWPDDLAEVVYIDHYGNLMTGLRQEALDAEATLTVKGQVARRAETFGAVGPGKILWYVNSNGLVEIAANGASAAAVLGVDVGEGVTVSPSSAWLGGKV